jgi:phosphoglycolate phosphatase
MRSFIFDLDGTLVSVKPEYRYQLLATVLAKFGKTVTNEHIDRFWFMPDRERLLRQWGIDPLAFWNVFRKHDLPETRRKHTFAFNDVGVLSELHAAGNRIALYTSALSVIAEMELELIDKSVFDCIVIANPFTDITPKPDPMGALECLKLLGSSPKDTFYVGNSDEDILTAKNAGIYSVLIDRGEHTCTEKPDMIITSLTELQHL